MTTKLSDFSYKLSKLREAIENSEYDALEINSQANFSWLTRGRSMIGLASVAACGSLVVTADSVYLVAENIEAERLYVEQLDSNPFVDVREFPWNQPEKRTEIMSSIATGKLASEQDLADELFRLRTVMTNFDISDYREISIETARILEATVKGLCCGVSGYELTGELAKRFWASNLEPITLLSAFDARALKYRHPIPAADCLENYAMVAVCTRRNGLVVSATRNVLLREDAVMIGRHESCVRVDAVATSMLMPGVVLGDIFDAMTNEYALQGYPGEQLLHHQGGLTGFLPREIRANTCSTHKVRNHEVYAFNPSLQGAKCEDTILITNTAPEVLTHTGDYTYTKCEVGGRELLKPTVFVQN